MDKEEDLFIKYNVPVEIIGKIIGFVPSKKNCFLVSKTFHRESINATRKKSILRLDQYNIMAEGFMNVQWAFNEIIWNGDIRAPAVDLFITRSTKFFEKFGSQVEKLLLSGIQMNKSDLLQVLNLMPNLVEIRMQNCRICGDKPLLPTLELSKFENSPLCGASGSGDKVFCPSIETFSGCKLRDLSFLRVFKNLKSIELLWPCKLDEQSIEHLCQLKLTSFALMPTIDFPEMAALIERQPQLASLRITANFQAESLRQILKLQHLESLQIKVFGESVPEQREQLMWDMMRMPKLKKLDIEFVNGGIPKALFTVESHQLESLTIRPCLGRQELQQLPSVFPKLKSLKLRIIEGNLNCIMRLKKLELLNINFYHDCNIEELIDGELEVNKSVRELRVNFLPSVLVKLVRMMPNIEKLKITKLYGYKRKNDVEMKKAFDVLLGLKNLVEIECANEILLNAEVQKSINNCAGSSTLQQITFLGRKQCPSGDICYLPACDVGTPWSYHPNEIHRGRHQCPNWEFIVLAFKKQFSFERVNFNKNKITMSRC